MELGFRRIQKEITEIERNSGLTGNSIKVYGDNDASHLCGSIRGPQGTPYEEGVFQVDIRLPQQYPFVPPKMQFITKVWHPNISSASGAICLDILKDKWSPALTLNTALLSLQALLSAPEPNDPQDAVVARQYLTDYEAFLNTARNYTNAFANELGVDDEDKIQRLVDKGFPVELVRTILQKCCGDENWALEKLLLLSS